MLLHVESSQCLPAPCLVGAQELPLLTASHCGLHPQGVPPPHPGLTFPRSGKLDFPTGGLVAWVRQTEGIQAKPVQHAREFGSLCIV